MRLYQAKDDADLMKSIFEMIEKDTDKKIFAIRVVAETEQGLETIVVFEDKNIMMGIIKVQTVNGKIAIRMQGNFI